MESKPIHILLAEDDEAYQYIFKEAFGELKLTTEIQIVNDGEQLMTRLEDQAIPLPDVIFLDLNMPRKNGLECLKEIRSDKRLKDISIAIFSTSSSEKDVKETFMNGANVYLTKPNNFNTLKKLLEKAVTVAHLYQKPPFNKENFLLKV